jgi:hypothetical protein
MRKIVLAASFLLALNAKAQQEQSPETKRLLALQNKLEGTYQVQIVNLRKEIAFPLNILDEIESRRSQTETVTYWLQDHIRIIILPGNVIDKPGFRKLSPAAIHTNE